MTRPPSLLRSLGLTDATLLVIGCIVGVGIFRTASSIGAHLTAPSAILAVWVIGGLVSICGALCYAELAAMFPASGGDYIYLRETFGRVWAFLFGWTTLFIERTGTIAILGVLFAEYLSRIVAYDAATQRWVAASAIILLTGVNVVGVRWGKYVQNLFTVIKILALVVLSVAGIRAVLLGITVQPNWSLPALDGSLWQAMGMAMVFVLWTYGGWTEAAYVAEEVKDPTRNVPRAIILGLAGVTGLYLLVNWAYLLFIPVASLPQTPLVASAVMEGAAGAGGGVFIAWMVACSAFGALNGYILTGARILYALGKEHALFARLAEVHPRFHTPAAALWANAGIAVLLVFTKTFEQIMTYSTVVIQVFFMLAVAAVMILRRSRPRLKRPYRVWGYPVTPIVFLVTMVGFIAAVCWGEPMEALFGFGLLALGVPLYALSQRSR